jgi:hypothetical protein
LCNPDIPALQDVLTQTLISDLGSVKGESKSSTLFILLKFLTATLIWIEWNPALGINLNIVRSKPKGLYPKYCQV